jgi:hypothetical protein
MLEQQNKEHRKLEELLKELITRTIDTWCAGEGDIILEIRDEGGDKRAKIKGGSTTRIR